MGVADCDTREDPTGQECAGISASATGEDVVALGQVPGGVAEEAMR
jgi:hypothetical protein